MGIGTLRRYYAENQPKPDSGEFTEAAAELLADEGIAEADYDGEASGKSGDVLVSDVRAWLEAREA